jgi:hypothetical protein
MEAVIGGVGRFIGRTAGWNDDAGGVLGKEVGRFALVAETCLFLLTATDSQRRGGARLFAAEPLGTRLQMTLGDKGVINHLLLELNASSGAMDVVEGV